jgi:hypothetical protein
MTALAGTVVLLSCEKDDSIFGPILGPELHSNRLAEVNAITKAPAKFSVGQNGSVFISYNDDRQTNLQLSTYNLPSALVGAVSVRNSNHIDVTCLVPGTYSIPCRLNDGGMIREFSVTIEVESVDFDLTMSVVSNPLDGLDESYAVNGEFYLNVWSLAVSATNGDFDPRFDIDIVTNLVYENISGGIYRFACPSNATTGFISLVANNFDIASECNIAVSKTFAIKSIEGVVVSDENIDLSGAVVRAKPYMSGIDGTIISSSMCREEFQSTRFDLSGLNSGVDYYCEAWIDLDASGGISPGDYYGYAGDSSYNIKPCRVGERIIIVVYMVQESGLRQ